MSPRSLFLITCVITCLHTHKARGDVKSECLWYCMTVANISLFPVLTLEWLIMTCCPAQEHFLFVGCCCHVFAFIFTRLYKVPSRFTRFCYNVLVLHRIWWNTTSSTLWRRVSAVLTPLYWSPIGNFQMKTCPEPLSKLAVVSPLQVLWQHMIAESNSPDLFWPVWRTGAVTVQFW